MALYLETLDGQKYSIDAVQEPIPCFRCGLCCTYLLVKLTTKDIRILSNRLRVSNHDLLNKYVHKTAIGPVLRQTGNRCVFLSYGDNGTTASCAVYAFRPEVCRNWVPSLCNPQCQEGLRKLKQASKVLLPTEIYELEDDAVEMCSVIVDNSRAHKVSEIQRID
jgi:Fe-S-cluster containining protein